MNTSGDENVSVLPKCPEGVVSGIWASTVLALRKLAEKPHPYAYPSMLLGREAKHILEALWAYDPDAAKAPAATHDQPSVIETVRASAESYEGIELDRDDVLALLDEIDALAAESDGPAIESFTDRDGDEFHAVVTSLETIDVISVSARNDDSGCCHTIDIHLDDAGRFVEMITNVRDRFVARKGAGR
jgi:hypothetical protein